MIDVFKILPIIISAIAIILTAINMLKQFKEHVKSKAPVLILEKAELSKYPLDTYSLDETLNYDRSDIAQFTLDTRCFNKKTDDGFELTESLNSLILDTRFKDRAKYNPEKAYGDKKIINFITFSVRNIGFDIIKFSIDFIKIYYIKGMILDLAPNRHHILHIYLRPHDIFKLSFSCIYYKNDFALFVPNAYDNSFLEKGIMYAGDNLFNSYIPELSENYEKIEICLTTTNKYNKDYKQRITFYNENNIYYSEAKLVRKC